MAPSASASGRCSRTEHHHHCIIILILIIIVWLVQWMLPFSRATSMPADFVLDDRQLPDRCSLHETPVA